MCFWITPRTHTEKLEMLLAHIQVMFHFKWKPLDLYLSVCLQDASHPGPSPSSAGVLVPPKVASITSELLAHAKVQLPLNMWVHLRVLSAHPTRFRSPSFLRSARSDRVDISLRSKHDFRARLLAALKMFPLLCPELLAMFHHLCNHIYSSTGQGSNPPQKEKYSHTQHPLSCVMLSVFHNKACNSTASAYTICILLYVLS